MTPLQAKKGSFSGHETFPLRYTWLRKAVQQTKSDMEVFGQPDAMVRFGVGKNMVRSIRHWGLACGMIGETHFIDNNRGRHLSPTTLGSRLFVDDGWDPYMEDQGTLWLIHWKLASSPELATTWFWVFNHAPAPEFTKRDLVAWLSDLVAQQGWKRVAKSSLKRDVDCFIRTYIPIEPTRTIPLEDTLDCPLVELGLIRQRESRGTCQLVRSTRPTLPDGIFAYGLAEFIEASGKKTKSWSLDSIALEPGSPGRVFGLSEEGILSRLENLETITRGGAVYDETAGLRQILVRDMPKSAEILKRYYERRSAS